ncbi:MAG: DUF5668 domain-containing protein [Candidatus Brocadiia bacterium]
MRKTLKKFLWALLFIVVGGVILMSNYGMISVSFDLAKNWPIILIAWGLLKLLDVFFGGHKDSDKK